MKTIPIVIGNYNKNDLTQKCVDSIEATADHPYEIVQVNNGCDVNRTVSKHCLNYDEPLGFTRAYNEGMVYALNNIPDWDKLLICNNDVTFEEPWLKELSDLMDSEPKIAIVSPCCYLGEDRDRIMIPVHSDILGGHQPMENKYLLKDEIIRVNTIQAFCALLSRDFLTRYGLLDESMVNFCSDQDMCLRAGLAGWAKIITQKVRVVHALNATINSKATEGYKEILHKDQSQLLLKWSGNYLNEILKKVPLFQDKKNMTMHIMCFIKDHATGEVRNYFTNEALGGKNVDSQDVRKKYKELKSLNLYE
jgi:GT2 family glycosyltransferase